MFSRKNPSYIRNIIGLHGKAGSGKNYIGEQIIAPMGYWPWAFAWPLKTLCIGKGLCTFEQAFYLKHPQTRQLLQEEGTERGRDVFGENFWVNTTLGWLEVLSEAWGVQDIVITDCRFPNEIQFVQDLGGKVYHIEAPTRTDQSGLDSRARQHRSETSLDEFTGFDGIINNDIGRTDVLAQVIELLLRDGMVDVDTVVKTWGALYDHAQAGAKAEG